MTEKIEKSACPLDLEVVEKQSSEDVVAAREEALAKKLQEMKSRKRKLVDLCSLKCLSKLRTFPDIYRHLVGKCHRLVKVKLKHLKSLAYSLMKSKTLAKPLNY
jgi:hypothetical protein